MQNRLRHGGREGGEAVPELGDGELGWHDESFPSQRGVI